MGGEKTNAGPSTTFDAKSAPNFAQDDKFCLVNECFRTTGDLEDEIACQKRRVVAAVHTDGVHSLRPHAAGSAASTCNRSKSKGFSVGARRNGFGYDDSG